MEKVGKEMINQKESKSTSSQHNYAVSTIPTVSIIMNCLNGEKYLKEAIDSIYAQTYTDWEIIFYDNGSTDRSADIAKSYDNRLRYFRGEETVLLYAARNLALKQARGRYIAFLDTDDLWLPKKLEWQVPLIENDGRIGLVHSNCEMFEESGSITNLHRNDKHLSGRIFRKLLRQYNIALITVMISRKVLDSMDEWFDSSLNLAGDADLFLRIAHEWNIKYLPRVTAVYRKHGENLSLKCAESVPVEIEYIIGKFSKLYKDFGKEYEMEIIDLRMRAQKGLIVSKWKSGKNWEARRLALRHLRAMCPFVLVWLLSFFPYKVISFVRNSMLWQYAVKLYKTITAFLSHIKIRL